MAREVVAEAAQEAGLNHLPQCVAAGDVAISGGSLAINEPPKSEASVCLLRETNISEEQRFLSDWERGLATELCHYVRVRQIYRAGVLPGLLTTLLGHLARPVGQSRPYV